METKRLLNSTEVAVMVGKSKDWVHKNIGVNGFPNPYYVTGNVKGWKVNQIETFLKGKNDKNE